MIKIMKILKILKVLIKNVINDMWKKEFNNNKF